jgi:hypothetical protein
VEKVKMNGHSMAELADDAVWPGSVDEFVRLLYCIGAHCTCQEQPRGAISCPAHQLLFDQRALDHLVFGRRMRDKLVASEFQLQPDSATTVCPPSTPLWSRWTRALRCRFVSKTT